MQKPDARFTEEFRKEVFLALVTAQDQGSPVAQSRQAVAANFGLTEGDVIRIEREGGDAGWPPLDRAGRPGGVSVGNWWSARRRPPSRGRAGP